MTVDRGFQGRLSNIDVGSDLKITHINIDKSAKVQAEIVRAVMAISKVASKQGGDAQQKGTRTGGKMIQRWRSLKLAEHQDL